MIKLRNVISYLINFKKPYFQELDFVDLIIDDKPLFLISWELKNGYKLKIKPLKKSYRSSHDAYIIQLPADLQHVKLVACNFWRKKSKVILLKHTRMDSETASLLLKDFRPLKALTVKSSAIKTIRITPHPKTHGIKIFKPSINIIKSISFKANRFNYH